MPYQEGQRVTMSAQGREAYPLSVGNPYDEEGTIIKTMKDGRTCRVRWDNGKENNYAEGDLDAVGETPNRITLRKQVTIARVRCEDCRICRNACPTNAIQRDDGRLRVRKHKCDSCGICVEMCPEDRIAWADVTVSSDELTDEDKRRLASKFSEAPRSVMKATDWLRRKQDSIARATDELTKSLSDLNGDVDQPKGAEVMLNIRRVREVLDSTPYSTLGEAAAIIQRGFMKPRETAIREIEGVLKQFDNVSSRGSTITVITKNEMVVRGVNFGKFRIELHLPGNGVNVTAVNPNWARGRHEAPHPHVERDGGGICMGGGGDAWNQALRDGRICDALLLVQSVLNEYGQENPYHSMNFWHEKECWVCDANGARYRHNCARGVDLKYICDDHAIFCSHCGKVACAECAAQCSTCGVPLCGMCAKLELCNHKSDVRNREWTRRLENARERKGQERIDRSRRRVEERIQHQVGEMESALERRRRAEQQRIEEAERKKLRDEETERFKRLSEREQKQYLAGHSTPEGHAGFLGDEDIDSITSRYAAPEPQRTGTIAGGECPQCGEEWCDRCNCCHECGHSG